MQITGRSLIARIYIQSISDYVNLSNFLTHRATQKITVT